jgi:hypothetical protein
MYVASQSSSQIVLFIAAVCWRDEREECKMSGLICAAAATSAAYAARRLTGTTWEREDTIMRYLTEIYLWTDMLVLSNFSSAQVM